MMFDRYITKFNLLLRKALPERLGKLVFGLPTGWFESTTRYCRQHDLPCTIIDPARPASREIPVTAGQDLTPHFRQHGRKHPNHDETFVATLFDGTTISKNGYVVTSDGLLLLDVSRHYNSGPGYSHRAFTRCLVAGPANRIPGRVALLASEGSDNYFHWLLDLMPRIALLKRAGFDLRSFDRFVLPRKRIPLADAYLDLAEIPKEKVLFTGRLNRIEADEMIVPSYPNARLCPSPEAVRFLREEIAPRVLTEMGPTDPMPTRIHIRRKSRRCLMNPTPVENCLRSHGFQSVEIERFSLPDQIRLFSNAEAIVGVHGAGFANTTFCRPGTKILEFSSPVYLHLCFWDLACSADLDFSYLPGVDRSASQLSSDERHDNKANVEIPVDLLESQLEQMNL